MLTWIKIKQTINRALRVHHGDERPDQVTDSANKLDYKLRPVWRSLRFQLTRLQSWPLNRA